VVQNSQCGGAKEVTFKLPPGSGSGCQIGIHSIGFDCSPPPSSSTPPKPSSTPASSKPYSAPPSSTPALPTISSVPVVPSSYKPESSYAVPSSSSTPAGRSVASPSPSAPASSSPASSAPYVVPSPSSTPNSPNTPSSSSVPVIPSSYGVPLSYGVPSSYVAPSSSVPVAVPSSSTPDSPVTPSSSSVPAASSYVPVPSSSKPSPPAPSAPCPDVLPQCLNTWLHQTDCKDNSDVDCYCKKAEYTKNVIQCVTAYGIDTTEIQKALSYFIGICAAYVPQNPGLITNCPSSIPLTGASPPPASSTPNSPVTVSSSSAPDVPSVILTTVVVSTSITTCPAGQTITDAGKTTVLPTPSISTIYVTSTSTICTKCAAPPASTPAAPVSSAPGIPYTTITVAQTYTVPCTYSTGVSMGYPIPSSSTVTTLSTSVVVPQVQFTTATPVAGSTVSIGLAQGPPTQVPVAGTTPASPTTGILTAPGGFGTTYVPSRSASSSLVMQTVNAAPRLGSGSLVGLLAGGALAMFAL
jgi:hypothetical protein